MTAQRDAAREASRVVRRRRLALLVPLRDAPTTAEALRRCADLIECRPTVLLSTDVHVILECCFGVSPEGADAIQDAVGMHRAYKLADLPYTKAAALVAVLRLNPPNGSPIGRAASVLRTARRELTEEATAA